MTNIDLGEMSLEELNALEKEVARAIKTYTARKKKDALAAADAAAREHGFSLSELTSDVGVKAGSLPKYRHPENASMTWSGRGRKPKWFIEALEAGIEESDLLVAKA